MIACIYYIYETKKENRMTRDKLNQSLIDASAQGDAEEVKSLINLGADVNAMDSDALRAASYHGHTEVVWLLLDAGANVHARDDCAIRSASYRDHADVVKLLLDAGADAGARDDHALQSASEHGHAKVVKLLLDAGADVHAMDDYALRMASEHGHDEVVKILIDWKGAKVSASANAFTKPKEENRMTRDKLNQSLIDASAQGDAEEVKSLLKLGADVHAWDSDALRSASKHGQTGVVELLLEAGAISTHGTTTRYVWRASRAHGGGEAAPKVRGRRPRMRRYSDAVGEPSRPHGGGEAPIRLGREAKKPNTTPRPNQPSEALHRSPQRDRVYPDHAAHGVLSRQCREIHLEGRPQRRRHRRPQKGTSIYRF